MCCKRYHIIFLTFSLKFKCKICVQKENGQENGAGLNNQITIILFTTWPINCFSKAKSYIFHFHKNDVTWPPSANGLLHYPLDSDFSGE